MTLNQCRMKWIVSFNHSFDRSCSSCNSHKLANFTLLSQSDVRNLVLNLSKKSCSLDPMPTRLVVECLDTLLPVLTKIINLSLQTGKFHSGWKLALVRPVPKKPNAEMTFSNFRPISNLSYVSKLVEGAATAQILVLVRDVLSLYRLRAMLDPVQRAMN